MISYYSQTPAFLFQKQQISNQVLEVSKKAKRYAKLGEGDSSPKLLPPPFQFIPMFNFHLFGKD